LKDISELQRHDSNERVVLSVTRVTDTHSDNSRTPVTDELLGSSVENWLRRNNLGSGLVNKIVVQENGAVGARKSLGLLLLNFTSLGASGLILSAFSLAVGTLDISQFQSNNLVNNNAQNARRPQWVRGCVDDSIFLLRVNSALLFLELRLVCKFFRKIEIAAIGSKCFTELGLSKESHFPVKLPGHLALSLDSTELGHLREHFTRVLDKLLDTELDLANNIVSRRSITIPKLNRQLFVSFQEIGSDKKTSGLLEDGVQVILDHSSTELRLGELAPGNGDVWVRTTALASTLILLAEASGLVNTDKHDAKSQSFLLDVITLEHLAEI
jgi:hypothetical protein